MYLVAKAEKEIKVLSQQNLIQKTATRKKYNSKIVKRINELKNKFIESNIIYLNNILSLKLSKSNSFYMNLKNYLLKKLVANLKTSLMFYIEKSYDRYIKYLINEIVESCRIAESGKQLNIELNERDFQFFRNSNHKKVFDDLHITLSQSKDKFIGGFRIIFTEDLISYDHTIDNLIDEKRAIIENDLSNLISEVNIRDIEDKFNFIVQAQKKKVEDFLINYDFNRFT